MKKKENNKEGKKPHRVKKPVQLVSTNHYSS